MMTLIKFLQANSLLGTALTLAVTLLGCNRPSPPTQSLTAAPVSQECQFVLHDRGETEVCGEPQTIVTIGPNSLELLLALDVQPVGHAEYFSIAAQQFDQPARQIPYLGNRIAGTLANVGTAHDPSIEAIAALNPDLIIGDPFKNQDEYDLLSQIAPTLLFNYSDAERDWQSDLRALAQALDRPQQAERVIAETSDRIDQLQQAIAPLAASHPDVLLLLSEQLRQVEIETRHSACGSLVKELGFRVLVPPELQNSQQPSHSLSLEAGLQLDPDLIIVEGYSSDLGSADDPTKQQLQAVKRQWQKSAIAQSTQSSQDGKVYFTTAYLCHALLGPIGTEIFLSQLHRQLAAPIEKHP